MVVQDFASRAGVSEETLNAKTVTRRYLHALCGQRLNPRARIRTKRVLGINY